jgi:hypothetical protein
VKVGDLVKYTLPDGKTLYPKGNKFYIGLIVAVDNSSPWIRWVDDSYLEPLDNYDNNLVKECFEVISEGR